MNTVPNIRYILLCLLVAAGSAVHAQDLRHDMELIKQMLVNPHAFHAKIKVDIEYNTAFRNDAGPKQINTEIKIWDENYYYSNEMATMVINNKWTVGAYHGNKQIIYGQNNPAELAKAKKLAGSKDFPVDLGVNQKNEYKGLVDGNKHYHIVSNRNHVKSVDLFIDPVSGFFRKIIFDYADAEDAVVKRTVTEFLTVDFSPKFSPSDFSESILIQFKGKETVSPSAPYGGYGVLYVDPKQIKDF